MVQKSQVVNEHSILRALLAPLRLVRQVLMFCSALGLIAGYVFLSLLVVRPFVSDRWRRIEIVTRLMTHFARGILCCLQGQVVVKGRAENVSPFVVSNHLSYLDVLAIVSVTQSCFVTSQEMRETPGLGLICEAAGCLFVERRNRKRLRKEIGEIGDAIERGIRVTVFPEATSGSGEGVLPFRRPLFRASVAKKAAVQPICLNYREVNGESLSKQNRDRVFWYGDMTFVDHFWSLSGLESGFVVEVDFREVLSTEYCDEKEISLKAQQCIEDAFVPV